MYRELFSIYIARRARAGNTIVHDIETEEIDRERVQFHFPFFSVFFSVFFFLLIFSFNICQIDMWALVAHARVYPAKRSMTVYLIVLQCITYTHTGNTIAIIIYYTIKICTFRTAANTTTICPISIGAVFLPLLPWRRVTQDCGSRSLLITVDPISIYLRSHHNQNEFIQILVKYTFYFSP